MPRSLSTRPRFWISAAAVLLLGVPVALVARQRHGAWLRTPRPIGGELLGIAPAWLTEVGSGGHATPREVFVRTTPAVMRPCLAAAQGAR